MEEPMSIVPEMPSWSTSLSSKWVSKACGTLRTPFGKYPLRRTSMSCCKVTRRSLVFWICLIRNNKSEHCFFTHFTMVGGRYFPNSLSTISCNGLELSASAGCWGSSPSDLLGVRSRPSIAPNTDEAGCSCLLCLEGEPVAEPLDPLSFSGSMPIQSMERKIPKEPHGQSNCFQTGARCRTQNMASASLGKTHWGLQPSPLEAKAAMSP